MGQRAGHERRRADASTRPVLVPTFDSTMGAWSVAPAVPPGSGARPRAPDVATRTASPWEATAAAQRCRANTWSPWTAVVGAETASAIDHRPPRTTPTTRASRSRRRRRRHATQRASFACWCSRQPGLRRQASRTYANWIRSAQHGQTKLHCHASLIGEDHTFGVSARCGH